MFTGIIEQLGRIESLSEAPGGLRMLVRPDHSLEGLHDGESIAIEGVCLTAEPGSTSELLQFFLSGETLSRTSLGDLAPGGEVNLERSLAVGDRIGGHFVMGHVDGVGKIASLDQDGEAWELRVAYPRDMRPFLAPKGSLTVSGISLTVVEVTPEDFSVAVIPHTYEVTSLRHKQTGSVVNLEIDVLARYVVNAAHLIKG